MIYKKLDNNEPIRQGDIFFPLPYPTTSLEEIQIFDYEDTWFTTWDNIDKDKRHVICLEVTPIWGIVASQDCDALRAHKISLFEIEPFINIFKKGGVPKNENSWKNKIIQHMKENLRIFYLPKDEEFGFNEKMGIDLGSVFQINREELERSIPKYRKGRLNKVAYEHFRESIAQYFRRYPYDEWHPLDKKEFRCYLKKYPDVKPFPWQE